MALFLLFYFTAYGALQAYLYLKLWPLMTGGGSLRWTVGAGLILLVLTPFPARLLEGGGHMQTARAIGSVAWNGMAVSLWFAAFGLCGDAWNLGLRLMPAATARRLALSPRVLVIGAGVLILAAFAWGRFVQSRWLNVRRIDLAVPSLPGTLRGLRLALVSDLHLGLYSDSRHIAHVLRELRELKPDLIVSAGDLVDSGPCPLDAIAAELKALSPPLGKLAVLGNHDFYSGVEASLAFHERAGFRVLRGERLEPAPGLVLAGVDDPAGRTFGRTVPTDELEILPESAGGRAVILIKHQPSVRDGTAGRFALQLSGHTHGGQIFPFNLVIAAIYRFHNGLYDLPDRRRVYVSPGTATWGPRIRLFITSEITVFTLVPA
jgi:hypothetical protein